MSDLVIVTGASRGIGAAIALQLAEAGYTVGCLSRSGARPGGASAEAEARLIGHAVDVGHEDALRAAIDTLASGQAPLVGLVNNAGYHVEARSADMAISEWNEVLQANATSVVVASQAAFPHLKAAGGGLVVNIGSFFDKLGVKKNLAYCASKAAVGAITRVLAVEWAAQNISVVNVAPGFVLTDLNRAEWEKGPLRTYLESRIPVRRPGQPQEIAALVAGLFAMKTPFLTGETIYCDGAQGLVA